MAEEGPDKPDTGAGTEPEPAAEPAAPEPAPEPAAPEPAAEPAAPKAAAEPAAPEAAAEPAAPEPAAEPAAPEPPEPEPAPEPAPAPEPVPEPEPEPEPEPAGNTSGQGKDAVLPEELGGLNWGAFLLNWIWGIGNRTYIALLTLVPFVNFVMPFVLLFKGNKWAWAKRPWDDVAHFRRVQRRWAWAGLIAWVALILLSGGGAYGVLAWLKGSEAYVAAVEGVRGDALATRILGQPIKPGWMVTGEVTSSGPKGNADLAFNVTGPKGGGKVYTTSVLEAGKWRMVELVLKVRGTGQRFVLVGQPPVSPELAKAVAAYEAGDYETALTMIRPLAQQGDAAAGYNLGVLYDTGRGVAEDDAEAVKWYRMAAEQGHVGAAYNLGLSYAEGEGVGRDLAAAHRWIGRAARDGHAQAQASLGKIEKAMTPEQIAAARGAPPDEAPAAAKETEAAADEKAAPPADEKEPEPPAPADLSAIRTALAGDEAAKAAGQLRMLADKGDAAAQELFGDLHMAGTGVVKNYSLAGLWYRKAAAGNAEAQYKLAGLYAAGLGVPFSATRARELLTEAARRGHPGARAELQRMGVTPPPVGPSPDAPAADGAKAPGTKKKAGGKPAAKK